MLRCSRSERRRRRGPDGRNACRLICRAQRASKRCADLWSHSLSALRTDHAAPCLRQALVCPYTKKRFKTRAAFENHTRSKRYEEARARAEASRESADLPPSAAEQGEASSSAEQQVAARAAAAVGGASAAGDVAGRPAERPAAPAPRPCGTAASSGAGGAEEDESDEGWEDDDDDGPWEPRYTESLFDGHVSASFEANARYMQRAHSFFVPDMAYLVDGAGLFAYLQVPPRPPPPSTPPSRPPAPHVHPLPSDSR